MSRSHISIGYPTSSIQHPVSSIRYPVSSIQHLKKSYLVCPKTDCLLIKINYITNLALTCGYLFLLIYGIAQAGNNFQDKDILALGCIGIAALSFIILDILMGRLYRNNKMQIIVSNQFKAFGIALCILGTIAALAILYLSYQGYLDIVHNDYLRKSTRYFMLILILIGATLTALTTLLNVPFFITALKQNKYISLESIDNIGNDVL